MKNIKKHNIVLNVVSNIFLQFVTVISGLIIPRMILSLFGSEVNGLIGSLAQFMVYIELMEGGLGGVLTASLYKPLVENDERKIESILFTARSIYRKIGYVFLLYVISVAVIYPIVTQTSFSFSYVATMALIIGLQTLIQYTFSSSYQHFLRADKKIYVVSNIRSLLILLNLAVFTVISVFVKDIHILKLASGIVFAMQPLLFSIYVKKNYKFEGNKTKNEELIKNRWDGFSVNLAYFIHNSTDVTILTLFTNLITVSIYTVHAIVTNGVRRILQAISTAVSPNIGQLYAKGDKKILNEKFNIVEFAYFLIASGFLTVAGLLITPFILLYTGGITDANYNQPIFAIILVIAEFIYCIREPYFNLAQAAGRFKDMKIHAYIEAGINLLFSIILVNFIGLVGVAIGTLLGNTYRTLYHVFYLEKHILHRSPRIFFRKLAVFGIATMLSVLICVYFFPIQEGILSFVISAILYSCITALFYLIASAIFYRKELGELKLI